MRETSRGQTKTAVGGFFRFLGRSLTAFVCHTKAVFRPSSDPASDPFDARFGQGVGDRETAARYRRSHAEGQVFFRQYAMLLGITLAAMTLCVAMLWLGRLWRVSTVVVEGCTYYAPAAVAVESGVKGGDEYLNVDPWDVEARLKAALPLLSHVNVSKKLNGTVVIRVTEHAELYYTQHNRNYYVISAADMQVLEVASSGNLYRSMGAVYVGLPAEAWVRVGEPLGYRYLPYTTDEEGDEVSTYDVTNEDPHMEFSYVQKTVDAVMAWDRVDRVDGMELSDRYGLYLVVDGRVCVRLGKAENLERKLSRAAQILDREPEGELPVVLDVSNPEAASWREEPDMVLPHWAGNNP